MYPGCVQSRCELPDCCRYSLRGGNNAYAEIAPFHWKYLLPGFASESQAPRELHHTWRVSAGNLSELLAGSQIANRVIIVGRIEQIKCLHPDLELHFPRQCKDL